MLSSPPIVLRRSFKNLVYKYKTRNLNVSKTLTAISKQTVIYQELNKKKKQNPLKSTTNNNNNQPLVTLKMSFSDDEAFEPDIAHGESVVDRKSVFQGHCAAIQRVEHVEQFLSKLKENKKIENAFHNMWAYRIDKRDPEARIAGKSASIVQDCDDDGEQAAGGRLMSLLQILNVVNVMVVVTRWYGGIQLGPARFKHINNAARDSLVKGGFVVDGPQQPVSGPNSSGSAAQSKGKRSGKNKKR